MPSKAAQHCQAQTLEDQMDETDVGATPDKEVSTAVEATEPQSMDDTIRQTLDAINARGEEVEETEEQRADRLRDEKGRFAKAADRADGKNLNNEGDPVDSNSSPTEQDLKQEDAAPVTVPPELQRLGLRKEEAEAIAANPVALQAFMRRSEEMHKGLEQYRGKAQFGAQMEQALSPYLHEFQAAGISPDVAARNLFAAHHALVRGTPEQKVQMLTRMARDYGVDLGQAQQFSANLPPVDPQVQQLQSELQRMQGWIQQQNQAREWQERESLNSEISKFASDPANAHFEAVREQMAGLLQAGLARDLKDAYEQAIYANPTVRTQILAKQQEEAEAKRRAEAAQKAQEAKRAAAVNVSRKGAMPAAKPIGSMEDTIRAEAARLGLA